MSKFKNNSRIKFFGIFDKFESPILYIGFRFRHRILIIRTPENIFIYNFNGLW